MISVSQFKAMKDDVDPKLIGSDCFQTANNWNFPDDGTLGLSKIYMPQNKAQVADLIGWTIASGAITSGATSIELDYAEVSLSSGASGTIIIDNEQITFSGYTGGSLRNCVRGVNGTTATSHVASSMIRLTTGKAIDGIKQYVFSCYSTLTSTIVDYNLFCVVSNGYLYLFNQDWSPANLFGFIDTSTEGLTGNTYTPLYKNQWNLGISAGKVSMQVYGNLLYISNGINYPVIFYGSIAGYVTSLWYSIYTNSGVKISQMGAPLIAGIEMTASAGVTTSGTGSHTYLMTYTTAGGEEIIGTQSQTVSSRGFPGSGIQYDLYLPLGYSGTISRTLYKTKVGSQTVFYKLADIPDNTTMVYLDIVPDASLGADFTGNTNNACPKPYFLNVSNGCLYGAKNDLYPTQVYRTDEGIQVFDSANYIEISDQSDDNSPVEGIGVDFSAVLVGTSKNIYLLQPNASDTTITDVIPTRAFCGMKSGYTLKNLPSFGEFAGGLAFVSSYNDIRVMNGMQALPINISVDNVRTQNYGQNIRGSLNLDLLSYSNIYAEYFDYKYHLIIDGNKYVFDIRTQGWTKHVIQSASYKSAPVILVSLNTSTEDLPVYKLFNGQSNGIIEQEYYGLQYMGENVPATLLSGYILADADFKNVQSIRFWFNSYDSVGGTATINVIIDDNTATSTTATMTIAPAPFDKAYFDARDFQTTPPLDFQSININTTYRWLQYSIICTTGSVSLQKIELIGEMLLSQEG